MLNHENRIRVLFGTGLCIFITALIFAGIIFVKDAIRPAGDALPEEGVSTAPVDILPKVVVPSAKPPERTTQNPPETDGTAPEFSGDSAEEPSSPTPVYPVGRVERPPGPEYKKTLIFVIDDAGNNLHELEPFLRFPGSLTIAVLPALPYSAEAARRIRAAGKEVILHQPMEAIGGQDPGPGAIYLGMSPDEIRTVLDRNLTEIGPVAGMNNHQGSRVTMDVTAMETILALCQERGIYFLDSRTTADTVAPVVAERMGIKIEERNVFLDNIQQKAAMIRCVQEGLVKADRQGISVMIGHTWSKELAGILTELYPDLIAQGYSLSTLSHL